MEDKPETRRKWLWFRALVWSAMFVSLILNCLNNPRLAELRGPDILRLIAIGMFLGVPLGVLFGRRALS